MTTRSGFRLMLVAALLAASFGARAQNAQPLTLTGDAASGKVLSYTCAGCHGVDTAVNVYPTYHVPKLGGQSADYLEIALQSYRDGSRAHPTMQAQGAQLSDQDIADIAAYFASVTGNPETGISAAGSDELLAGQEKSAVCQSCHGQTGVSILPQYPNLAGQHASYLLQSMLQYKQGTRENAIMAPMVVALDEETLAEIAAFYAAQPGLIQTDR